MENYFFNPGISIFRISIYSQTNSESNPNSNIRYIRFSSNFNHCSDTEIHLKNYCTTLCLDIFVLLNMYGDGKQAMY